MCGVICNYMAATPNSDDSATKRRAWRFRAVIVLTVAAACVFAYFKFEQWREPYREARLLNTVIWQLVDHRPPDMTPKQWESAVAWTNNLDCNSLTFLAPADSIRSLRLELETKLDSTSKPIDMGTINWIWDSYAKLCRGGERYQRFRKQMTDEIASGGGNWGIAIP